jgi:anti-sigma factor RsiW
MTTPSFRDIEQLSAFLDGQLSQAQKTRLEARIKSDPALAAMLEELRQARTLLRHMPGRRAPRNFTLTPRMAGIRPPVPRAVPVLSWSSAIAMMLFACTLGFNLLGGLSIGGAAPKVDIYGIGGVPGAPAATSAPATAPPAFAPAATMAPLTSQAPVNGTVMATATIEISSLVAPEATVPGGLRAIAPADASRSRSTPVIPWLYIWLVLGVMLMSAALAIRWMNELAFTKRTRSK